MTTQPIRVVQVATGSAGRLTLRQLVQDARFELVGVSTTNPDKLGVDAGALAGLDEATGVDPGFASDLVRWRSRAPASASSRSAAPSWPTARRTTAPR